MPSDIQDYAIIGDCETAALVGRDGSIDWLCWPRFDSRACFAALLGDDENGRWKIAPVGDTRIQRRYRKGTLILETEFESPEGMVTLVDFMPLRDENPDLVRIVRGKRGQVRMSMELIIRFDYGSTVPWVTSREDGAMVAIAGPNRLVLTSTVPLRGEDMKTVSEFTINEGETVAFILTYGQSHLLVPEPINFEKSLQQTEEWWTNWSAVCTYKGPWADAVERSLITLKALTYEPTGGILAAATTSLPEELGGSRNWDYRFCWLRDATFTLLALMEAGYYDEAREWRNWLVRTVAGSPAQVQILYGLAGERQFLEWEVPWLRGHRGSLPVRVGNAAAGQLQVDVYGEIADALHQARVGRVEEYGPAVDMEQALTEHLEKIWQEPDQGIWEFRGPKRHFTHSRVMAWVAFDRAIKGSEQVGTKNSLERWGAVRQQIHDEVCRYGFDPELNSFVQSYGSKELDASLLLIAIVGFLPPNDPRVIGTVQQIEQRLMWNGFVRRYDTASADDGLEVGEGAFLACSFWLADNYILMGRREEAERLLKKLLGTRNDVGLMAEQYHPERDCLLGNFPQAFSHVALVNTVMNLSHDESTGNKRAETKQAPVPNT
jgi:GH15 family glucan-1,4-alpha-glucosidase